MEEQGWMKTYLNPFRFKLFLAMIAILMAASEQHQLSTVAVV